MYNKQTLPNDNDLKFDSSDYNCRETKNFIADFNPIHSPDVASVPLLVSDPGSPVRKRI